MVDRRSLRAFPAIAKEPKMSEGSNKSEELESNENMSLGRLEENHEEDSEALPSKTTEGRIQDDESSRLRELDANVRNQDELERDIGLQVCDLIWIFGESIKL